MLDIDLIGPARPPSRYLPPKVAWEDFHDGWDSERKTEWVDGEIIKVSPENIRHQFLTGFLYELFRHAARRGKHGYVFIANFIMRLPSRPSGRLPDIMFVTNDHRGRIRRTYLDGPADLAVEVISPDSQARDRDEKLTEYESAGIPEYWIIDESRREALFYVLDTDSKYALALPGEDGIYTSTLLPGLRVRVSWLWQWPLPDLEDALADLPA